MKYELVKLEELKVEKYNRSIDLKRSKKIAAFFNPHLFDPILVGYRDGNYTIIDGQHRVLVARLLGFQEVMCKVLEGLSYQQEAALFTEYNTKSTRKPLDAYELMKGKFESGDDLTVKMFNLVKLYGFTISNQVGDNKLCCSASLNSIITKEGPDVFSQVLQITKNAWNGDKDSLRGHILEGISFLITYYGNQLDHKRLSEKLKTTLPTTILNFSDADPLGGKKKVKVARQMLRYYNNNLSPDKKLKSTF